MANRAVIAFIAFTFLWVATVGAMSQNQVRAEMRRMRGVANYCVYVIQVARR
jgi:hypothetical protein